MIVYDVEKKRAIDNDTGIHLSLAGGSSPEEFWGFTVVDGDASIAVSARHSAFRTGPGSYLLEYEVDAAPVVVGRPQRPGYAAIIEGLVKAYAELHERQEHPGRDVVAQVTVGPAFVEKLLEWETIHGLAITREVA